MGAGTTSGLVSAHCTCRSGYPGERSCIVSLPEQGSPTIQSAAATLPGCFGAWGRNWSPRGGHSELARGSACEISRTGPGAFILRNQPLFSHVPRHAGNSISCGGAPPT